MVHSASANLNIIGEGWGYPPETVSFSLWVKAELADEEGANLPLTLVRRAHASQLLPQTLRLRGRQRSLVPVPRPYFTPSTKGREKKHHTNSITCNHQHCWKEKNNLEVRSGGTFLFLFFQQKFHRTVTKRIARGREGGETMATGSAAW